MESNDMSEVYKGRLLRLADFLEKLPPERFDFQRWVGTDWRGLPDLSCGTTACGLGWASTMPEFRELGLRLSNGGISSHVHPRLEGDNGVDLETALNRAVDTIFGINPQELDLLFVPTEDPTDELGDVVEEESELLDPDEEGSDGRLSRRATPKRLARHIRTFVELKYRA